ncbi:peptide chain release factor N(5)-glutamine methyltransferase [Parapedobacter sp. 10938]|uniref:peptide chain release factor N(5)-glutamine methyltransferase n=1 Tax=Parapedobacter flavus TaxID=3110225 RepID=UPI002DBA867D|nr:peptide chain release factor N(5)-glutamine methyltransferase [Parapedobacter sp. 10938]MEC3881727.1 peptide chain release factor N(5)-glutamine methyltransferase [Parapedobacter sp. 10938]
MQTLAAIEQRFVDGLLGLYPVDEIKQLCYLLAEDRFDWSKTTYLLNRQAPLGEEDGEWFTTALSALQQAKPIQYILGHTWFMGMKLAVSDAVLIPRPETEELVHLITRHHRPSTVPLRIIDIGTGSGCIAIALKKALPKAQVYALDVSSDALRVAQQNAKSLSAQINFIQADILEWDAVFQNDHRFDIVVSNPPYITTAERGQMHSNVLEHEPHLALFVQGDAPLLFYEHIAAFASSHLLPDGNLYVEINRNYGKEVSDLFHKKGFRAVTVHSDMQGADRMVCAKK